MRASTMAGPHHDIVELADALPSRARVLDLGCGDGGNAFFLAERGCRVTAVDRSTSGIEKLRAVAQRADVMIDAVDEEIVTFPITGRWDVILAHGVIDSLDGDGEAWRRLLATIKEHTAPGGFNASSCLPFSATRAAGPDDMTVAGTKDAPAAPGELATFYADWSVVRDDRYETWNQDPPRAPLRSHPTDKIIAQRPSDRAPAFHTEEVPIGEVTMPRALFDTLAIGVPADELLARCGEPAVVDTYTMAGAHRGVGTDLVVHGYNLSLWYYGRAVLYVVDGRVSGRALYASLPVRIRY